MVEFLEALGRVFINAGGLKMDGWGVEFRGKVGQDLTEIQKKILDMIINDLETPKGIAARRQTSLTSVYNTLKVLKQKGYLKGRFDRGVEFSGIAPTRGVEFHTSSYKLIRLHRQEFSAKILSKTGIYASIKSRTPFISIDGNKVRLYKGTVEIYSHHDRQFIGNTAQEAHNTSLFYWGGIFRQIEEKLGILIAKQGNIKEVNSHYAEVDNELAAQAIKEKQKISVKAPDGKNWLLVDASTGSPELETVHPQTALRDMQDIVQPFFRDLRAYYDQTGQNLLMTDMLKGLGQMAATVKVMDANMMTHIKAIQELGSGVRKLTQAVEEIAKKSG